MNHKFQLRILTECENVFKEALDWKSLIRLYKNEYSAVEIPDDDEELHRAFVWGSGGIFSAPTEQQKRERLHPPQKLMATIAYLEELGLIVSSNQSRGQIPDVKITAPGIKYLNRPCWIVRILKEAIEKSLVNGIGFILGIISTWVLIKILPV